MKRGAGILLPIFSLASNYGIGTFGKKAYEFVDYLKKTKVKYWQLLPLNPTSYGDSPYQSFSAFALNPYFIDLDMLIEENYLTLDDVKPLADYNNGEYLPWVDYGFLYENRFPILRKAYENAFPLIKEEVLKFESKNKSWIVDYSLFMVIKYMNGGDSYLSWKVKNLRTHKKSAINKIKEEHLDDYYFWIFLQYMAFKQYTLLKKYANKNGVLIIGDIPIYVALDSADTWSNPKEFLLNSDYTPSLVAGVPPDYFSEDGQLWGNPLYNYAYMKEHNFKWWRKRISHNKNLYDVLRIDHFRGMASYYTIPYGSKNAKIGEWVEGPRMDLVSAIKEAAGKMEIIAEDLGLLTDDVVQLKHDSGWPGLKIFEFGFDGADYNNEHLPKFWTNDSVAYIGTHDNDTLVGYLDSHKDIEYFIKDVVHCYDDEHLPDAIIGELFRGNCNIVLLTMQDLLHQNTIYRINTPGTVGTNWKVRLPSDCLEDKKIINTLQCLIKETGR